MIVVSIIIENLKIIQGLQKVNKHKQSVSIVISLEK